MKLWAGPSIDKMPDGYTYIENFEDAISLIGRCERIRKIVGEKYKDLWSVTEINVPFDEVDKYSSLFSFVSKDVPPFVLNRREKYQEEKENE